MNTFVILKRFKEKKITIYKLAEMTDLGYATVYDVVNGKIKNPRIETIKKIAKALELDINEIL